MPIGSISTRSPASERYQSESGPARMSAASPGSSSSFWTSPETRSSRSSLVWPGPAGCRIHAEPTASSIRSQKSMRVRFDGFPGRGIPTHELVAVACQSVEPSNHRAPGMWKLW